MRSALLCVFFTLIILRERIHAQDNDFRPMPIPINDWHQDRRGRAATLHETFRTESTPTVAAVPAHYWEDALRHSVYLTLVRDKIDQLIAKGGVVSPNGKHGNYDSKEIDDHDLWDKIKTAPFDRIQEEEPDPYGDVTIMAKGRLLEDERGFRFAEDERSKEKCSQDNCTQGVKAFWSVKRVRQRDQETSTGKYHYELTFSVISQMPKKQRKPHENPIRTFTVKESSANDAVDRPFTVKESASSEIVNRPQERRQLRREQSRAARPERAIWFHKNIAQAKQTGRKHYFQGLDRIFSSIFSDDEERAYDSPHNKYKQSSFATPPPQIYSKVSHIGFSNEQQIPFSYKPHPMKYVRPPLQAPPVNPIQNQYSDNMGIITANGNPYNSFSYDHRVESSQAVKTTRPAVLPTPLPQKSQSGEVTNVMSIESTDNTSTTPDTTKIHRTYNNYKPTPVKVNYFTDHVRPPIYSAPPGVFVTMDKKPFKPMPPLKLLHSSKPYRTHKPIDFRPSPQLNLDVQNTDYFADTAFRPITMNFDENKPTEISEHIEANKKVENKPRKPTATGKKPPKKHDNTKSQRTTTATPDIITAQSASEEEIETMDWANVLGAFTKTTPMFPQTEKTQVFETTTPMTTTMTTTTAKMLTTTTTEAQPETTVSTTAKPIKRTRPPPKFVKQDKIKKHKRLTTTTTTTSTTNAPENIKYDVIKLRPSHDLTPQASSAATGVTKSTKLHRESNNRTQTTTTTTTSTTTTTTTKPTTTKTTTTTTQMPRTTTANSNISSTTRSKSKNRFRQSTLMYKGTSVKHDKWKGIQNQTVTIPPVTHYTYRRKGSNFQGYISSTTPRHIDEEKEKEKESHADGKLNTESNTVRTTSHTNNDETVDQYDTNTVLPLNEHDGNNNQHGDEDYNDESKDHSEFIFQPSPTPTAQALAQTISTPYAPAGNKTKCKKKKLNMATTEDNSDAISTTTKSTTTVTTTRAPTETPTTSDMLEDFLNFNFNDDDDKDPSQTSRADLQKEESSNHESYLKIDDFEDFLDIHLTGSKNKHSGQISDDDQYLNEEEDEDNDEDDDEYEISKLSSIDDDTELEDDVEKEESGRQSNIDSAKAKRPYSLLELMAMS